MNRIKIQNTIIDLDRVLIMESCDPGMCPYFQIWIYLNVLDDAVDGLRLFHRELQYVNKIDRDQDWQRLCDLVTS